MKFALVLIFIALFSNSPSNMVMHSRGATVVVINPAYYHALIYSGRTSAPIAFNVNYYDPVTLRPINVLMEHSQYLNYMWDPTANTRPCLYILKDGKAHIGFQPWVKHRKDLDLIVEGGPTLLGKPNPHESLAPDTTRCTDQVSVGINPVGLLYVAMTHNLSMKAIASLMSGYGCIQAFKLDGGNSAHLQYNSLRLGNPSVVCGLAFVPKT